MTTTVKKSKEIVVNNDLIMLNHNLIYISGGASKLSKVSLGTIFANMAYYGYALSKECIKNLKSFNENEAAEWWATIEPSLKEISGDNRKMDEHVVYKNFPQEVLDMSQSEYWLKQILMYIGFPNEWFTEEVIEREKLDEKINYKVLHLADDKSLEKIFIKVCGLPARWTEEQFKCVEHLINEGYTTDASFIPFKENTILYVKHLISENKEIKLSSAMDVLRLAIGISDGDVTMKTKTKFRKFARKERKMLLALLNETTDPIGDAGRDPERWKRLLHNLHPNEYGKKYSKVCEMYNLLYNDQTETFNSKVEVLIAEKNVKVFDLLRAHPGDFMRRFANVINNYGELGVTNFISVLPNLSVSQLLKVEGYLNTINKRIYRTIAPKGNWNKLQILENKAHFNDEFRIQILAAIAEAIKAKISKEYPTVFLDECYRWVGHSRKQYQLFCLQHR